MKTQWSLSKLGTYEKCGAQYDYRYLQKLPSAANAAASRGINHHAIVEAYINTQAVELTEGLEFYKNFFDSVLATDGDIFSELKLAVTEDWQPCDWEGGWGRGVLDLLVIPKDAKKAYKYDWKTGKMYDDHYEQKELYAALVFAHYPQLEELEAIHVYLDLKKNTSRTYHRSQMADIQAKWSGKAAKLDNPDLTPSPGFYCRWCGFSRSKGGPCRY